MVKGSIFTRKRNGDYLAEQLGAVKKFADIISHTSGGDTVTASAVEEYCCYDRENELPFVLRFGYKGRFCRLELIEEHTYSRRDMLRRRSACDRLIKAGEKDLAGRFFTRYSPDGISGVLFFLPEDAEAEALAGRLHSEAEAIHTAEDIYLSYTIYLCCGEVFDKLCGTSQDKLNRCQAYYSGTETGQPGIDAAEYLLGCRFELSQDDACDIAIIKGEPNSHGCDILRYKKLRSE